MSQCLQKKLSMTLKLDGLFYKVLFYTVLSNSEYNDYKWHICADFKVVAIFIGLQPDYTKFCCFLWLWDS